MKCERVRNLHLKPVPQDMPRKKESNSTIAPENRSIDNAWAKSNTGWIPPLALPYIKPLVRRGGRPSRLAARELNQTHVGMVIRPLAGCRRGQWFALDALQLMPEAIYVHTDLSRIEQVMVLVPQCPVLVCERITVAPYKLTQARESA